MSSVSRDSKTVLLMAGGTGGHVFPALAVADELRSRGINVAWLGTRRGLEADVVPKAGIDISFLNVSGLRGNGIVGWLQAPFKLMIALLHGVAIMRKIKPAVVLGMGGFVTGPGGVAAWVSRIPLVIHEQNAVAGLTNKLLVPFAKRVLEAFPGTLENAKTIHTGNPVRSDIGGDKERKPGDGPLRLLVVGGSLGAKALNEVVPNTLILMPKEQRPDVWHQTGKKNIEETQILYQNNGISARVDPFIDDMAQAYAWADAVLCRAGALTIAELAVAGLPSILVPYPFAVDDHQTSNGRYLVEQGAAIMVQQNELNASGLKQLLESLSDRKKLQQMSEAAKSTALPQATARVADLCMEVSRG